jgi:hypothetical protein
MKLVCASSKVGSQIPIQGCKNVSIDEGMSSFYFFFFWIFVMNTLFIFVTHHYTELSQVCLCFSNALVCFFFYLKCFVFVVLSIVFLFLE